MLQLENVLEIVEMENIYQQQQQHLDLQLPQTQLPQTQVPQTQLPQTQVPQTQLMLLQKESYNLVWIVQMVVQHVQVAKIVKLVTQDLI